MHMVILGAGVIGVTTAYQLLLDGHQVTLVDRNDDASEATSFGNAGLIAPGHSFAWASPKAPGMMLRSMVNRDQAIRFSPRLSLAQAAWTLRFLRQCTAERAAENTRIKSRLCAYSQRMLNKVVAKTGVTYDGQDGGLLYFYRSQDAWNAADRKSEILRQQGIPVEKLNRDQTLAKDPGLANAGDQIAGSVYAPTDESGDCNLFTKALAKTCQSMGAEFHYGTEISDVERKGGAVTAVITNKGPIEGDAFVLCLGVYSPHLAKKLGIKLPIYPVKGYSMTAPIIDYAKAPRLGGVDEANLLAYCPMGDRLRITATAEIAGYDTSHKPSDFDAMIAKTEALFPGAVDFSKATSWAGLRPMTPTGIPVVDRSPVDNFWLNTGHGHMGWTMAAGCARILADLVGQRQPGHSTEGLRYG